MAKQQGLGVVAAARRVSDTQGKFQDVGGQFMTGYNKSLEAKKERENKNKETQSRVNNLMGQFKNDIDILKFKPEDQALVKNSITEWRNGYAEAANIAAGIKDKSSAAYQEQVDIMNNYKNRMVNLKSNLDNLSAFKGEYTQNIEAGTYSNAGANDMALAQGEVMLQYPIGSISDNGDLTWNDEAGGGEFGFQDYQMPFGKANGLASALGDIAGNIRTQSTPLDNVQKNEIDEKVDNLLKNPKALASLISDSDLPGFDFSNIDPEDPNARAQVKDLLVKSIYDLQGTGVKTKKGSGGTNENSADAARVYSRELASTLDTMLESGMRKTIQGQTFTPLDNPYGKFKDGLAKARKSAADANNKINLTIESLGLKNEKELAEFMDWYNGDISDEPVFESGGLYYTYDEMMKFLVDLKY